MKRFIKIIKHISIIVMILFYNALSGWVNYTNIQQKIKVEYFYTEINNDRIFRNKLINIMDMYNVYGIVGATNDYNKVKYFTRGSHANELYNLASLSKAFTAVAVIILHEEKILNIDKSVNYYVKSNLDNRTTLRHLLSHSSGLCDGNIHESALNIIYTPTHGGPGRGYYYTNQNYVMIDKIIRAVTKKTTGQIIKEKILIPLKMDDTIVTNANGAGGVYCTFNDLVKFCKALINLGKFNRNSTNGIFNLHSHNLMMQTALELQHRTGRWFWSAGWEIFHDTKKHVESFYKGGRLGIRACGIWIFPNEGRAIIYLIKPPESNSEEFLKWRRGFIEFLRRYFITNKKF